MPPISVFARLLLSCLLSFIICCASRVLGTALIKFEQGIEVYTPPEDYLGRWILITIASFFGSYLNTQE